MIWWKEGIWHLNCPWTVSLFINACLPNVILQRTSVQQYPGWCVCNSPTQVVRLLVPYFNTYGPTGSIATVCNEKRYWDLQLVPADSAEPYRMGAIHKQDLTLIETQTPMHVRTYTHTCRADRLHYVDHRILQDSFQQDGFCTILYWLTSRLITNPCCVDASDRNVRVESRSEVGREHFHSQLGCASLQRHHLHTPADQLSNTNITNYWAIRIWYRATTVTAVFITRKLVQCNTLAHRLHCMGSFVNGKPQQFGHKGLRYAWTNLGVAQIAWMVTSTTTSHMPKLVVAGKWGVMEQGWSSHHACFFQFL